MDIFKAYDIRGKVETELTELICERIGRAFADWLPEQGAIAVGRDMRPDSQALAAAIIEGLRLQGRDVWDIGQVTTDMLYFAVGNFSLAGGAMVTASHNPGDYNGVKLCAEEAKPVGEISGLFDIRDRVQENDFVPAAVEGKLSERSVTSEWIAHVLQFVDAVHWPAYKVAVDAGNGMAGSIFPELAKVLPIKIIPLYFELDGSFPNHIANPMDPANLVDVQREVRQQQLDFGIAFDGDGDRAVLIDEKGRAISGTVMTAMLADYFLQKQPGSTILYNAICGRIVPQVIEARGGYGERTRVGHSFIKADMREQDAIFAGEHSGHYYFKDNYFADSGLIAAMIAIQVVADSGKNLSEIAAQYTKGFTAIPETNFTVTDKEAILDRLSVALSDGEQDWLDGLTVTYEDGWVNVRPSNTEPLLRLNAEAHSEQRLNEIVSRVTGLIEGE